MPQSTVGQGTRNLLSEMFKLDSTAAEALVVIVVKKEERSAVAVAHEIYSLI